MSSMVLSVPSKHAVSLLPGTIQIIRAARARSLFKSSEATLSQNLTLWLSNRSLVALGLITTILVAWLAHKSNQSVARPVPSGNQHPRSRCPYCAISLVAVVTNQLSRTSSTSKIRISLWTIGSLQASSVTSTWQQAASRGRTTRTVLPLYYSQTTTMTNLIEAKSRQVTTPLLSCSSTISNNKASNFSCSSSPPT